MRTLLIYCILLLTQVSCAQPSDLIVKIYTDKKYYNISDFLFSPDELILLCEDSTGRASFTRNLARYAPKNSQNSSLDKEKKVLITSIYSQIKSIETERKAQLESKSFIEDLLIPYLVDFDVDEKLLIERFKWDESRAETCDIENSLYVFFVYDPQLYIKVAKSDKELSNNPYPFPFSCTLENPNIPRPVRINMKKGLLKQIRNFDDPILINIYNSIESYKVE